MADASTNGRLREWLVRVFSQAIGNISNEADRHEISDWLQANKIPYARPYILTGFSHSHKFLFCS